MSTTPKKNTSRKRRLRVAGLFAGIGGIESGLHAAGHETVLLCENDEAAAAVLDHHFPGVPNPGDIRELDRLPARTDVVTAGFPCQDLSQAGATRGMKGRQSSLVEHVFRLLDSYAVRWVVLENVSFMLQLQRGAAIRFLVERLEALGYAWAYRVIDSRAFGLPQRRQRVILLASRDHDPAAVLFQDEAGPVAESRERNGHACGFYWTEGLRGLGWAVNCVPTLKGGSGLGIPSPPAIWLPQMNGKPARIVTPGIEDAEALQGFPRGWTEPAETVGPARHRWRLVGNAVTVDVAAWVGDLLMRKGETLPSERALTPLSDTGTWPRAAFGAGGRRFAVDASPWPMKLPAPSLEGFLVDTKPLSARATAGFLERFRQSSLRKPPGFVEALTAHRAGFAGG